MKIAIVDPSLFTWPYDVRLAQGLEACGHRAVIFGTSLNQDVPKAKRKFLVEHFYPSIKNDRFERLPRAAFLALKGISHILSMLRLIGRLRRERPDFIHFQWAPLAVVDKHFIPWLRRVAPVILTVHDSAPFNNDPSSSLQRISAIRIMNHFDQLIVHTEHARERLLAYGLAAEKINIVPHGQLTDLEPTPPPAAEQDEQDTVKLLLFGYLKPYKGIDVLLHAIAKLPGELRQKCHLRIVGKPLMPMQPLVSLVHTLGLGSYVTFDLRFVSESEGQNIMAAADIHVYPYREIDASGVLTQSLALGRAIVASDIGLFREMLVDGIHGCLIPPGDSDALANALASLIADKPHRDAAAQAVRELGQALPGWQEIGKATEQVYRKAMERTESREPYLNSIHREYQ